MIIMANNTTNSSTTIMPNYPSALLSTGIQMPDHFTANIANKNFEKYS